MTEPKRALISTDAVGGVWAYTLELVRALQPEFTFEIAVLGPPPSAAQMQAAHDANARLHVTGLALDWTATSRDQLAEAPAALSALARRHGVDFVQLHSPALVWGADWHLPVLAVLHSCLGTWWQAMRKQDAPPADFTWRMQTVKAGLQAANAVIAPSRALADAAQAVYQTNRTIQVVNNTRLPAAAAGGKRNGVLAAGRLWDEAKNIAMLERAAAMMKIPVSAAGATSGPNGAQIALQAVRELGALSAEELQQQMGAARIFAAPALYEPFGLTVLEAAQAGLPLVLADIPSFRELWNGAALFLPPNDPEPWARTLTNLHARPQDCEAWGKRAQAHAARYGTRRFARAMGGAYYRLLGIPPHAQAA